MDRPIPPRSPALRWLANGGRVGTRTHRRVGAEVHRPHTWHRRRYTQPTAAPSLSQQGGAALPSSRRRPARESRGGARAKRAAGVPRQQQVSLVASHRPRRYGRRPSRRERARGRLRLRPSTPAIGRSRLRRAPRRSRRRLGRQGIPRVAHRKGPSRLERSCQDAEGQGCCQGAAEEDVREGEGEEAGAGER